MKKRVRVLSALLATITVAALSACAPTEEEHGEEPVLQIQDLVEDTSEFQAALIEDGEVTPAEYEQALLAWQACVAEAGATPGEIYAIGNEELTFDFEITAANENAMQDIQDAADLCLPEYFTEVSTVWAFQQLLTPAERSRMEPDVVECLQDAGFDLDDDADLDDIEDALSSTSEASSMATPCYEKFPGYFSVAPTSEEHHH